MFFCSVGRPWPIPRPSLALVAEKHFPASAPSGTDHIHLIETDEETD